MKSLVEFINESYGRADYEEILNKIKSGNLSMTKDEIEQERESVKKEMEKFKDKIYLKNRKMNKKKMRNNNKN